MLPEFKNEPYTDFTQADHRQAMEEALKAVDGQLGREYDLIIGGSNDILLERTISLFNRLHPEHTAVFGNLGSLGGIRALRRRHCHIASSHLLQENEQDYNFGYTEDELDKIPAIVNFCMREQGLLLAKTNPKGINDIADLTKPAIRIVNRSLGTGTRLLFDRELKQAGVKGEGIEGYQQELERHLDVGLEVLSGRVDAGPGIRTVACMLDLAFISFRWERFDLIVSKERFFDKGVQLFLGFLQEPEFREMADALEGYDLSLCGKMVFPQQTGSSA